ncbi:endonuclease domain-containing protein [Sphingomonas sp. Root241]|uniref:endonuclease domain-containing protein n=1 Tax=Sphingomonas sp. Root241 TaxID=1736501 RepID=UPI0006F73451|nr:endonuclease domain-containing protein [Sphingomonas sp. Root241]KRC81499.1 DNA methylase [Sphingomonas sp. Root241]
MYPVRRQINPHAAKLRRDATDAERRLLAVLRNRQIEGCKFRFQATIGPFVADFLCVEKMLIVELDGGQHNGEIDRERTRFLQDRGYRVLRFWNNDVLENLGGVVAVIISALAADAD